MKRRRALRPSAAGVAAAAALVTLALTVTGVVTAGPTGAGAAPAKTIPTLPPSSGGVTTAGLVSGSHGIRSAMVWNMRPPKIRRQAWTYPGDFPRTIFT